MLSWQHVHAAVKALRWIFIGGILWIVDVKFNSFDVLDDTVGTLLITALPALRWAASTARS